MGFDERPEWRLLVALGVGLVVGLERERARDAERPRRWAGLRTFGLTSLLGGVALQTGSPVVLGVAGIAIALFAVVLAWRAEERVAGSAGSLAARSAIPLREAGLAVLLAVSTNAVTKMVLAATSGPRAYLVRVVGGQLAVLAATWAGWVLGGR